MNGRDLTRTGVVGSLIQSVRSVSVPSSFQFRVFSREKHSLLGGRGFSFVPLLLRIPEEGVL